MATDRIGPRNDRFSIEINRSDLSVGPHAIIHPNYLNTYCGGPGFAPSTIISSATMSSTTRPSISSASISSYSTEDPVFSEEDGLQAESPISTPPLAISDDFAMAFDIDGVLIRGGKPIPEAVEAMKYINGKNPYGLQIPYIFLTNGGGKTEEERCQDLSRQLDVEICPGQFICGHTPMREMAERHNTVLVVGGEGEKCRIVAEAYGFKNVVTPGDIIKTRHDTTPFRKLTEEEYNNSRTLDFDTLQIEAIFVFADSRDWAGDQQIILDCLMSKNGYLNQRSETMDEGPPVYFSHNDIVWSTSHDHVRIGMGALRASLEALYKAISGKDLKTTAFGKPQMGTFQFATRLLQEWRKESHGIDKPPSTVYFFGDTPESDVRGTNEFDKVAENEWFSILVKTGVYQDGTVPRFAPKKTCDNILDAVKFAVEREQQKIIERGPLFALPE